LATGNKNNEGRAKKLEQADSETADESMKSWTGIPAQERRRKVSNWPAEINGMSLPDHVLLIVPKRRGIRNNNPRQKKA